MAGLGGWVLCNDDTGWIMAVAGAGGRFCVCPSWCGSVCSWVHWESYVRERRVGQQTIAGM